MGSMKNGWKDFDRARIAKKANDSARSSAISEKRWEAHKANANIGSDAEIAAYLARVPKPYHYVEGEVSDE